jgi:hypothetical protein
MDRRSLLLGILTAAASGTLLSESAQAASMLPEVEERVEVVAIPTTLEKARRLIAVNNIFVAAQRGGIATDQHRLELDATADNFIGHLIGSYEGSCSADEVRSIMAGDVSLDFLHEDTLSRMAGGVVPVALMRELCKRHKIVFDPKNSKNFSIFCDRYKDAIHGAFV